MFWFILLFPLMIYPWGPFTYYTFPKVFYLDMFVLFTWLLIIIKKKYWTTTLSRESLKIEYILLVFFCLVGLSTIFSVDKSMSFYGTDTRFEGLVTFFSYCSVLLFSYRLMDTNQLEKVLPGLIIVSIPVSIYGILQHYSLDFFPRNSTKLFTTRSWSFFDNANFFGSYLALVILLASTLYLSSTNKKFIALYYIAICIAFVALIFSGTRSGLVGIVCGGLLLSFFVIKQYWKKWIPLLVSLILLIIVIDAAENGSFKQRLDSAVTDSYKIVSNQTTGNEGSNRFFIWRKSLPLIKEYFWLGSGPDTFEHVFPRDVEKQKFFKEQIVDKAHNEYLQMAITLGVPALLTYLILLVVVLSRAFKATKSVKGYEKLILIGLISTIIGYLAQAFFNISVVPVAPIYWAVLGITLAKAETHLKVERDQIINKNNTTEINQTA
ncbi:O-antigen ligase family protein [Neobacillus drentensis]|uniref:O-antigen ligase family protein n=1 Tax=Neobacillus drentensis TaxID=220684 RepID=UPI002FFEA751